MVKSVLNKDTLKSAHAQLLSEHSTTELKNELLALIDGRDSEPLKTKVQFYQNELTPYIAELNRRNPFPSAVDQVEQVLGVWTPIWSTIPFHDILPGRIREQSYQIFKANGYYANVARYEPGHQFSIVQKFSAFLAAYDLMVMQKFSVRNGQWCIQNVAIEQSLRRRDVALTIGAAEEWFTSILSSRLNPDSQTLQLQAPQLDKLDRSTVKKFEKTYLATPLFEHLYVDPELRIVKTQREQSQRPSYTIAVRR